MRAIFPATCARLEVQDSPSGSSGGRQDLEFASIMVQNLNLIMITSPELSEFRKRLRTLDSKVRTRENEWDRGQIGCH